MKKFLLLMVLLVVACEPSQPTNTPNHPVRHSPKIDRWL